MHTATLQIIRCSGLMLAVGCARVPAGGGAAAPDDGDDGAVSSDGVGDPQGLPADGYDPRWTGPDGLFHPHGQAPPEAATGPLWLASAAEFDAFCRRYDRVDGDLTIDAGAAGVSDLTALACLVDVSGELSVVGGDSLVTAAGLSALGSVGGDLRLRGERLTDVGPWPSLSGVGGVVDLDGNPALVEVAGFDALTWVGQDVSIQSMASLQRVAGFDRLESVDQDVLIYDAPSLDDVAGFGALEDLRSLRLSGLDSLEAVRGFPALARAHSIYVSDNPALIELAGLQSLEIVYAGVEVARNDALEQIGPFPLLTQVGALRLVSLPSLRHLAALPALEKIKETLELSDLPVLAEISDDLSRFVAATRGESLTLTDLPETVPLDGLSQLADVHGDITLTRLPHAQLTALQGVSRVFGDLTIDSCAALQDLSAFSGLTRLDGVLTLRGETGFVDLSGIDQLDTVGGLTISGGNQRDLIGLEGVTTVSGTLTVQYSDLRSVDGLDGLVAVGGDVRFIGNYDLATADIEALVARIGEDAIGGTVLISNNGS